MQEIIETGLLAVVAVLAVVLIFIGQKSNSGMTKKQKIMLGRILAATIILLVLQYLGAEAFEQLGVAGRWVRLVCYLVDYYIIGYDILRKAFRGIRNGQVFDENFLMAVATVGAFALAIYENGDYLEAIAVMLFYQVGEWFQSYAVGKSRRNISDLMDIRPDYANIERDGKLVQVDPEQIAVGEQIVVKAGEKVPLDGVVLDGSSFIDTAALTGESLPRSVEPGDDVVSGCINQTGLLHIQVTKPFGESTVSKILDLVENAGSNKARAENFITKFAKYYTPCVVIGALLLALIPPLFDMQWSRWIGQALIFLVISCPCALVISVPLSFFGGIGGASKCGILVKGGNYMEVLAKTEVVVFDKTGTLTKGVFNVTVIHPDKISQSQLLELAAIAESYSEHPVARSIREAYGQEIDMSRLSDVHELSGRGVCAVIDGRKICVGNDKLMEENGVTWHPCHHVGTTVHVEIDGTYAGHIVISDEIKEDAAQAVRELKKQGVQKTVMLTGDAQAVGESVGKQLGLDEVYTQLLPAGKVERVEVLLQQKSAKGKLAFVGDGINDAPVLSRADVGIAMGAMGSDAAIEAADIVLMDDRPSQIAKAVQISRKTLRIVRQNIIFALTVKAVFLVLGAIGLANMWEAVIADVGVSVLAIINAMRALKVQKIK